MSEAEGNSATPPMPNPTGSGAAQPNATRDGRSNRNRRRNGGGRGRGASQNRNAQRTPKFEGRCDDLKGHIYDFGGPKQSDMFTKTTREIGEYVGRTYKYGNDVRLAITNMAVPTIQPPADPPQNATRTEIRLWEKRCDEVVKRETHLEENMKTLYSLNISTM